MPRLQIHSRVAGRALCGIGAFWKGQSVVVQKLHVVSCSSDCLDNLKCAGFPSEGFRGSSNRVPMCGWCPVLFWGSSASFGGPPWGSAWFRLRRRGFDPTTPAQAHRHRGRRVHRSGVRQPSSRARLGGPASGESCSVTTITRFMASQPASTTGFAHHSNINPPVILTNEV